jgi:1-acyl-sn-glycerol-3-phosphate acyltransferase
MARLDGGSVVAGARTFVLVPLFFVYTMAIALAVMVIAAIRPGSGLFNVLVDHWASMYLRIPPVRWTVDGLEHIDPSERYVVASNHLSMFDIPLLFKVLPFPGRFLAKKELFRLPLIGRAMTIIGIIEIDRDAGGGSSRQAINLGVTIAAERGYSLLVFPEGTRSRDASLLPFKKGAFRIAIDTGLPLLPVVIEGTNRISRPHSKIYRAGSVSVRVLPPIATGDMTNRDDLSRLTNEVETSINDTYASMRAAADV